MSWPRSWADDSRMELSTAKLINPLPEANKNVRRALLKFVEDLSSLAIHSDKEGLDDLHARAFRAANRCGSDGQALRVAISVLCDLKAQGWDFKAGEDGLSAQPPLTEPHPDSEKARLRSAHLLERDNQLREPSTQEFIRSMESPQLSPNGWVSIFSLMRDGRELASKLRAAAKSPPGLDRESALEKCIQPYIQWVEPDAVCPFTGLRLIDIWRYFRHTWTNPYNNTPGRRMWILIRDRAAENHPVIGIAALASSVVQLTPRDRWIGWTPDEFIDRLRSEPSVTWAKWVARSLNDLIRGTYRRDFLQEAILGSQDLRWPNKTTINRLLKEADRSRERHRMYPNVASHKAAHLNNGRHTWRNQADSALFRAKRAKVLASLLSVRLRLLEEGFTSPTKANLIRLLAKKNGQRAIEQILRCVKAVHVGIDMLDITVCGAIQPYNSILGGKLVALLLASPEITTSYKRRYTNTPSIIASSMAGSAVCRKPTLVLLGTTSLYGVGSSQYNRLKLPSEEIGGKNGSLIRYEPLGHSLGYGSFHVSAHTVDEVNSLLAQSQKGRHVNSIFGEGVSPRFRKVRDGLDLIGLPSNMILNHGSPRIIYGIALASNFQEILLGRTRKAKYILPQNKSEEITSRIASFWIRRWLSKRIEREEVLAEVGRHTLAYPITHGARVVLPSSDDNLTLFPLG
jgi:hypothetical protein